MGNFLYLFRRNESEIPEMSPEQMQQVTQRWINWITELDKAGQLADRGNRLKKAGKVVRPEGLVTDGPYVELKEAIGGFIVVKADNLDAAAAMAKGCPIFSFGGNVEVREIDVL